MFNEEMTGGVPFDIEEEDESGSESEGLIEENLSDIELIDG